MNTPRIIPKNSGQHHTPWYLEKVETPPITGCSSGLKKEDTLYNIAVTNALENTAKMLEETPDITIDYVEISKVTQRTDLKEGTRYCTVSLDPYRIK